MIEKRKFTQNVIISIAVQIISLSVSFVLGFVVPKLIDEYQYAYWQTYILYVGYAGVLHFGLLDGIVLRYSQYNYDELDKEKIRSQFKILFFSIGGISATLISFAIMFLNAISRSTVILVSLGILSKNLICYNSYLLQITNRIDKYAILTIVQRVSYGIVTIIFLFLDINHFEFYCIADIMGDTVGIILARSFNKEIYFGSSISFHDAFVEWRTNVSSGIILMLVNWSALLLNGFAKMIVQWHWDELVFGKISFSFSLSSLFLTFVTAVSIVLFPQLKRMEQGKFPEIYANIRGVISPLLFIAMLLYYPGCQILEIFLPKYRQSLIYLGLLLPIIVYTSKMSLLTNNYLKAYRKEKAMLAINILSFGFAAISFAISAFVFESLSLLLICVVLSNFIKSVLSERAIEKEIKICFTKEYVVEFALTMAFIVYTYFLNRWIACIAYFLTLVAYLWYSRKNISSIFRSFLKIFRY